TVAGCASTGNQNPAGGPVPERTITTPPGSPLPDSASPTSAEPTELDTATTGKISGVTVGETIASGLETPWGIAFVQDGSALVTLRDSGKVLRIDGGEITPLDAGGPDGAVPNVLHESEGGLLGIAVGPDHAVFLYLTTHSDNRVVRFDLSGDTLVNSQVILQGIPSGRTHNGGRLEFGPDGYLYVTTGDARRSAEAQQTDSLAGKILRVTASGDPAPGNPFGNEVWSYGHRNVQGIGWTSEGRMYASEFGNNERDELNLIEPGNNYGWPHVEGWVENSEYSNPVVDWPNSEASPSGIAVTDAGVWLAALRGKRLWYVPCEADGSAGEPRAYLELGRLRDVILTPDGKLWVVTSNTDGRGDPEVGDDRIVRLAIS